MPVSKTLGYVILEGFDDVPRNSQVVDNRNGHVIARGILQTADERNRNGRYYPHEELFPQLTCPRTQELLNAGYFLGEMGHPLSKELVRQQTIDQTRTCVRFLKLWTEGMNVMGEFCGTNNEYGKTFEQDLLEGYKPAFSLRALGSVETTKRGAEVRNLKIIVYDSVIYPSHPGAYTTQVVSESGDILSTNEAKTYVDGKLIPITNDSVLKYIRSESSNLKYMKECFDFMYDRIDLNEAGSTVTLTGKDGNIFVVNLESYIANEIMNYCSKLTDF